MKPGAILIVGYGGGESFLRDSPYVRYLPDLEVFVRVNPPESSAAGLEETRSDKSILAAIERLKARTPPVAAAIETAKQSFSGLEESWIQDFLDILEEAAPQGPGVLVIEAAEISRRMGLAEFVARVPKNLKDRLVLFGQDSAEVKEIVARNGIAVVDSDQLSELALQLMVLGDKADRVGFLGDRGAATALAGMLPMEVTPLDPETALGMLLLFLEYPDAVLKAINAAGAEELFARARAA